LIPPFSSKLYRIVREPAVWDTLVNAQRTDGTIPEDVFRTVASLKKVDVEQLKGVFRSLSDESLEDADIQSDETPFRYAEYRALQQERRDQDDLLACRPQQVAQYGSLVRDNFQYVTLVERLAETRALTGFSRIKPGGTTVAALSREAVNWRPAFRVHGEGVFLVLRTDRVDGWRSRLDERSARLVERGIRTRRTPLLVSSELVLLHSLAHLLIKRLSYEAGYGASSIRERIYSAPAGHSQRMCGLLLYTAAGDADGTLGGLVTLGRPEMLERVIEGALEEAAWCAGDPICMESTGQGPDSLNLAACHACSLLPETSCELQNRLLDRKPVLDFFS
jgi:MrfA Zn-binding domain